MTNQSTTALNFMTPIHMQCKQVYVPQKPQMDPVKSDGATVLQSSTTVLCFLLAAIVQVVTHCIL